MDVLGHRYRSASPYDISKFELMNSSIMAYPQPIYIKGKGHFLIFLHVTMADDNYFFRRVQMEKLGVIINK